MNGKQRRPESDAIYLQSDIAQACWFQYFYVNMYIVPYVILAYEIQGQNYFFMLRSYWCHPALKIYKEIQAFKMPYST